MKILSILTGKELSIITCAPVAYFYMVRKTGCFNSINFRVCVCKSKSIVNRSICTFVFLFLYFYDASIHNISNKAGHIFISFPNITTMNFNTISTDVHKQPFHKLQCPSNSCFLHGMSWFQGKFP